jgi:hypothetical protein
MLGDVDELVVPSAAGSFPKVKVRYAAVTTIGRLAVVVGVAGLAIAGCGDDGGDALSEEEFVEQANEICAEGEAELQEAGAALDDPTSEDVAEFAGVYEENVSDQIDELDDLEAPESIADDVDAVLTDAREALEDAVQLLHDDPEAAFAEEEDPFADVNEQLTELGLDECAS